MGQRTEVDEKSSKTFQRDLEAATEHIETVCLEHSRTMYPQLDVSLPKDYLPFIPPEEVIKGKSVEDGCLCRFLDVLVIVSLGY